MMAHRFESGRYLRELREALGLTLRDVHQESLIIAQKYGSRSFAIPPSRLHAIERKRAIPNIHRSYTLASIYACDLEDILWLYGVPRI
ncbi:MAG: helix-turn-helix transcriptional regulator [Acidobacteria bacterium]|nr:helix-turn-helix transcriptional regulator [Acidobacteriota bacterium]